MHGIGDAEVGYGPGIHRGESGTDQVLDLEFAILVRDGPHTFTEEWTVVLPEVQVYRVGCRGAAQAGKDQGSKEYRSCGSHAARFYGAPHVLVAGSGDEPQSVRFDVPIRLKVEEATLQPHAVVHLHGR